MIAFRNYFYIWMKVLKIAKKNCSAFNLTQKFYFFYKFLKFFRKIKKIVKNAK